MLRILRDPPFLMLKLIPDVPQLLGAHQQFLPILQATHSDWLHLKVLYYPGMTSLRPNSHVSGVICGAPADDTAGHI